MNRESCPSPSLGTAQRILGMLQMIGIETTDTQENTPPPHYNPT